MVALMPRRTGAWQRVETRAGAGGRAGVLLLLVLLVRVLAGEGGLASAGL